MALDDLLAALEREALAEREVVLRAARAEADRMLARARAHSDEERGAAMARLERELRESAAAATAEVRRAARHDVLTARQQFLARVFDAATARLPAAGAGPGYRSSLPRQLEAALACVGDAPSEVHCAPAIADAVRAAVGDRARVTVRPEPDAPAGFRVLTTDGAMEVDATLEGELVRRRASLALELLPAMDGMR